MFDVEFFPTILKIVFEICLECLNLFKFILFLYVGRVLREKLNKIY